MKSVTLVRPSGQRFNQLSTPFTSSRPRRWPFPVPSCAPSDDVEHTRVFSVPLSLTSLDTGLRCRARADTGWLRSSSCRVVAPVSLIMSSSCPSTWLVSESSWSDGGHACHTQPYSDRRCYTSSGSFCWLGPSIADDRRSVGPISNFRVRSRPVYSHQQIP